MTQEGQRSLHQLTLPYATAFSWRFFGSGEKHGQANSPSRPVPRRRIVALRDDHAERLGAARLDAALGPPNSVGWDLRTAEHGRVQVTARSCASKHLNWFGVRNVHLDGFDYLVLYRVRG